MNSLEGIGAREANNPFLRNLYPDMPEKMLATGEQIMLTLNEKVEYLILV